MQEGAGLKADDLPYIPPFGKEEDEMKNFSWNVHVLLPSKFVCDLNQKVRISPLSLLLADPYLTLSPAIL